ncbi:ficolin-1-like [Drosophila takahashii]|uniref:ficolin-1-like n=1 Tax=Drosophila takahashii TaxID=29030 RepID=UPI00389923F8
MHCIKAYLALVAFGFCITAGVSDPLTSVQLKGEIETTSDALASIDKLLLDLEARRESLWQMKETISNVTYPSSCLTRDNVNHTDLIVQVPGQKPFAVVCDSYLAGLGWLVIQRRRDGLVNFYRDWSDYKEGFGDPKGDFFIGLEKLNWLTAYQPFELYIHLEEFGQKTNVFAKYDEFLVGGESEHYALKYLGSYSGTAGDSLSDSKGQQFSTFDVNNYGSFNKVCAQFHLGAWWYKDCGESNLNGQYFDYYRDLPNDKARFISWNSFNNTAPFKFVQMMIRPKFGGY